VAEVAGSSPIILIASPSRARRIQLRLCNVADPGFQVMGSAAVAADELIAVASNGLASALDPAPRIDASTQGVLNMDDASPAQIGAGGTLASGATRSLFQTDTIALRLIFECSWALRTPAALAWVEDVIW
jgi:hypothetical protein